jgi:hypothetical protein
MSVLAVIARYNEDVSWVRNLKIPYLIINKGTPINDPNTICIENHKYGREAHTYLWYIFNYYDSLPESIIFLQGNPFDHQNKLFEFLEPAMIEKMPSFQSLTDQYSNIIPVQCVRHMVNKQFEKLSYSIMHFDENVLDSHPTYYDYGLEYILKDLNIFFEKMQPNSKLSLREKMHSILEVPYIKHCITPYFFSAMFKIDKNILKTRSKEYYKRLLALCDSFNAAGYLFERMWYAMFCEANVKTHGPCEMVVAHYNENLDWTKQFKPELINVYSKGKFPTVNCISYILPNIGRESHTYLSYIITRYDTLPDIVFFTQGSIAEHYGDPLDRFFNIKNNQYSSNNYFKSSFKHGMDDDYGVEKWVNYTERAGIRGDDWFNKYVNSNLDVKTTEINIFWGAVFSVRKEAILTRTKQYYQGLLEQLNTINPEVGHFIERSWYHIFNLERFKYMDPY